MSKLCWPRPGSKSLPIKIKIPLIYLDHTQHISEGDSKNLLPSMKHWNKNMKRQEKAKKNSFADSEMRTWAVLFIERDANDLAIKPMETVFRSFSTFDPEGGGLKTSSSNLIWDKAQRKLSWRKFLRKLNRPRVIAQSVRRSVPVKLANTLLNNHTSPRMKIGANCLVRSKCWCCLVSFQPLKSCASLIVSLRYSLKRRSALSSFSAHFNIPPG